MAPSRLSLIPCVLALWLWPPAAHAELGGYQDLVAQAVQEFSSGHWQEARALFRRAHQLQPNARTLRGLGMTAFELRQYPQALRELEAALQDSRKPLGAKHRKQVKALIERASAFVGRYTVVLQPRSARPKLDGKPASLGPGNVLMLTLGEHLLSAEAEGYEPAQLSVRVQGGERSELRLVLKPSSAKQAVAANSLPESTGDEPLRAQPAPPSPEASGPAPHPDPPAPPQPASGPGAWPWIFAGGSALMLGGATAFWLSAEAEVQDLDDRCPQQCTVADVDGASVRGKDLLTNVLLISGVAAAGVATYLFIAGGSPEGEGEVSLRIGPTALGVEGRF